MKNFKKAVILCSYFFIVTVLSLSLKTKAYGEETVYSYTNIDPEIIFMFPPLEGHVQPPLPMPEVIIIGVDVKPYSKKNPVSLRSKGVIKIALLGSNTFDVNKVKEASLKAQGAYALHNMKLQDVNMDNKDDLVVHFLVKDMALNEKSKEIKVYGKTSEGLNFEGSDMINLLGAK